MERKPKLFIASSVEGLDVAEAVNVNLEYESENTLWTNAFQLSSVTLTSLVESADSSDFGVFIFTPDDGLQMRGGKHSAVRDNVLFELGIFIGSLGVKRCFIVKPRNVDLHIPTDLAGVTIADYDPNRSDKNLRSALSFACTQMKESIRALGHFADPEAELNEELGEESSEIELGDEALSILISAAGNPSESFDTITIQYAEPKMRPYLNQALEDLESVGYIRLAQANRLSKSMIYRLTTEGRKYVLSSGLVEHI
ncbi:nucleotide-binding protein [Vibrio cholerae]|nr:nucleotide-binding protein [Vibrio cholerae]EKF9843276.1 nucleotide-binding protein [Vibrio cholerae]HDI3268493.1 nucleotide-binding protein [Vibrio cholerae]